MKKGELVSTLRENRLPEKNQRLAAMKLPVGKPSTDASKATYSREFRIRPHYSQVLKDSVVSSALKDKVSLAVGLSY